MTNAKVVIIGGGVMGVSLAYHLAKAGWTDVILVEKNDLTHGSTWHAAGLCTHFAHNATIQELRATSVRLYRDTLPQEAGQDVGFHACGAMRVTANPNRMDEFAHVAGLSEFTGYPLEIISPDRIADLHPLANISGLLGGIFEPSDGHVDPTLATTAMAKIATQNGVSIQRQNPVQSLRWQDGMWHVETTKETIRALHIVNAAGTWGWEIGQMMGLHIASVPILHQYLVTDRIEEVASRTDAGLAELPMIRDPDESWYVRQERDGLILGPYETEARAWSIDGVPPEFGADLLPADLDRVEHIISAAMHRVPALKTGGVKSVVNGPITFTPDANPLIGPALGLTNAWLLTGSSMGVMEGGGAGWFLAHWMTKGAPPMDPVAIDSRRFGSWVDRDYRVAKAVECFGQQFGVHYPREERTAARDMRLSPIHTEMLDRGAVMGVVNGWERPNWFSDQHDDIAELSFGRTTWFDRVAAEVNTVTTAVGIADLSVFSKFDIVGRGTRAFLGHLGANAPPATGKIGLIHTVTPAGGTGSEFTVSMLSDNHAYLTSAAAAEAIDHDVLRAHAADYDVKVTNATSTMGAIGVMGPKSRQLLAQLTTVDLDQDFPWLAVRQIDVAGKPVRALRVSYVGELGWELHADAADLPAILAAVAAAGEPLGLGYYGGYAADSMRLEKGYRGWGSDLTTERTLFESGLAQFVKAETRDFSGKDALVKRGAASDRWEMLLLRVETTTVDPFYAHSVRHAGEVVGVVTSGGFGHRTGQALALAYMRRRGLRTKLDVDILGKRYNATVLSQAPFDPKNERLKS